MLTQISVHKYHLRLFLHVSHICTSWRLHPCDHSCMLHALIMYRRREIHSLRIYIHVYMSEQSITGKMATIQSGIMYTCRPIRCFRRSPDFLDPRHTCTKSHVLSGCLHFVWTEPCWKQYILEYEEKRKNQQTQSIHPILYIYFSCKYNFVLKLVD